VDAKVAVVDAKVDGLGALIKAESAATREALSPLLTLPVEVARLSEKYSDLERRVAELEGGGLRRHTWRVSAAISLVSALIGGGIAHIPHLL
jgi:hypothetical protein